MDIHYIMENLKDECIIYDYKNRSAELKNEPPLSITIKEDTVFILPLKEDTEMIEHYNERIEEIKCRFPLNFIVNNKINNKDYYYERRNHKLYNNWVYYHCTTQI